jgi:D-glycero-D-manno-heptose 1,7-bisphosphate phosphatase
MTEMPALRPAAFLDRDGTIIHDADYLDRPEGVKLLPGAARAIAQLNEAAIPVVVVTNQSGIARGYFDMEAYEAVRARLDALLAAEGAHVDETRMCPHLPEVTGPCECRKPGTLLYRQAAERLGLDVARSWYVGDKWRDLEPGFVLGGRGILVPAPTTPAADLERARAEAIVAPSLADAVETILPALLADARAR